MDILILPYSVDVVANGNVWVADRGNHRIQEFDKDGKFLFKFGFFGSKPGQFNNPRQVAVDSDGNVYVTDRRHYNIQVFKPGKLGNVLVDTSRANPALS